VEEDPNDKLPVFGNHLGYGGRSHYLLATAVFWKDTQTISCWEISSSRTVSVYYGEFSEQIVD
jgi:hypothetical protein